MEFLSTTDSDSSLRIDENVKEAVSSPHLKCNQKVALDRWSSHRPAPPHTSFSAIQLLPPTAFLPRNVAGFSGELRLQNREKNQQKDSGDYMKPSRDQCPHERSSDCDYQEYEPGMNCLTLAEELIDIKKRLSAFQENKDKLR